MPDVSVPVRETRHGRSETDPFGRIAIVLGEDQSPRNVPLIPEGIGRRGSRPSGASMVPVADSTTPSTSAL